MSVEVHTSGQVTINGNAVLNVGSGHEDSGGTDTPVDLSGYVKKAEFNNAVNDLQYQMNQIGGIQPIFEPEIINGTIDQNLINYPEKKPLPNNQVGVSTKYGFIFSLPYQVGKKIRLPMMPLPLFEEATYNQIYYVLVMETRESSLSTLNIVNDLPTGSGNPSLYLQHANQKEMSGETYQMSFMFSFNDRRLAVRTEDVMLNIEMIASDYMKIGLMSATEEGIEQEHASVYRKVPVGHSNLIFRMEFDGVGLPEDFVYEIPYQILDI